MRSTLLKILFFCGVLFSAHSLGFGFHADAGYAGSPESRVPGDDLAMSMGIDIGFLTPYFIDAVLTLGIGSINDRMAFVSAFTAHYTAMLTKVLGVYTGLGFGLDALWGARFSIHRDPFEVNHTGVITKAIFPLGVKFFLRTSFEFYGEINVGVGLYQGWTRYYTSATPSANSVSGDIYRRNFYWDVHGRFGMRYWY